MATQNMDIQCLQEPEELQAMDDHPKTLRCYFFSVRIHSVFKQTLEQRHPAFLFRKQFKRGALS